MTNKELQEELKKHPDDTEVKYTDRYSSEDHLSIDAIYPTESAIIII